jgi:hypothetical protein
MEWAKLRGRGDARITFSRRRAQVTASTTQMTK